MSHDNRNVISTCIQVNFICAGITHAVYYKTLKNALDIEAASAPTFMDTIYSMYPIVKAMRRVGMGYWEMCRVGMGHRKLCRVGMGHWELCRVGIGHQELCRVGMGHQEQGYCMSIMCEPE